MRFTPRDTGLAAGPLTAIAEYWRAVREFYVPFESPILAAGADLYRHEMPGGQYTNLFEQARALGLADRWPDVCRMYADVNQLLGDIVKVTPTSKAVGDLALFLIANELSPQDVVRGERELAYPQSVIDLLSGRMGQPLGGFPAPVRSAILGPRQPVQGRPAESLPPADFEQAAADVSQLLGRPALRCEIVSSLLYPQVFAEFAAHQQRHGDTSVLPTPVFFYGMQGGEEVAVEIEPGKTLIIKLMAISEDHDGKRTVFFELNGQPRDVAVVDHALEQQAALREKADPADPRQVGAPMPGMVVTVAVRAEDNVRKGQKLLVLEAMKMQTTILAERGGRVGRLLVSPGAQVEAGDLLLVLV
jgi:pyruvate carboxylase